MPAYRIYRLKEHLRQQFRWAPHTSGAALVKPRDYEPDGCVEASGVYAAWAALKSGPRALRVGDLLESDKGDLFLCKYVGFDEAQWEQPEPQAASSASPLAPAPGGEPSAPAPYDERDAV